MDVSASVAGDDYVVTVDGDDDAQHIVATSTPTSVTFAAGGESMVAGSNCSGTGPVTCTFDPATDFVDVFLEDGNDRFDASAVTDDLGLYVDGGAGDDVINIRDGVTDSGADCGADFDLVILDSTERSWSLPTCENQQPTIAPVQMSPPRVGRVATMSGGEHQTFGPATALVTRQWYTCTTVDKQGCSSPVTADSFTPQESDQGRYLVARISLSLAEFNFLGALDVRDSAPMLIRARPSFGVTLPPTPPTAAFVLGAFKSGSTGWLKATFNRPGKVTVRGTATAPKHKRYVKTTAMVVSSAGIVRLPVKLTAAGKARLKRERKLKVKVVITLSDWKSYHRSAWVTFKLKPKKKTS